MLHLCSNYASKELPDYLEQLLRNISSHFKDSYKAKRSLKAFQGDMKRMILIPGQTRWLTKQPFVKRVIEEIIPLRLYWQELLKEGKNDSNVFIIR